jgi:hypothetical protein
MSTFTKAITDVQNAVFALDKCDAQTNDRLSEMEKLEIVALAERLLTIIANNR